MFLIFFFFFREKRSFKQQKTLAGKEKSDCGVVEKKSKHAKLM